jgi:uncharacterized membrane protein
MNNYPETTESNLQLTEDPAVRKVAFAIYIMYLASFLLPVLPIVGVVFAYIYENDAKTFTRSHYQYLIRSFWLAVLYFTVAGLLVFLVIGLILLPICGIWWLIRLVKGLKSLLRNEPIQNPTTWLF